MFTAMAPAIAGIPQEPPVTVTRRGTPEASAGPCPASRVSRRRQGLTEKKSNGDGACAQARSPPAPIRSRPPTDHTAIHLTCMNDVTMTHARMGGAPMGLIRAMLLRGSQNAWLRERAVRYPFVRRSVARFMPGERIED